MIPKMSVDEFVGLGFLQEVNRQFLHLYGLALEVTIDKFGKHHLSGVWDYRDDPTGVCFADLSGPEPEAKANIVERERQKHLSSRIDLFGKEIQPIGTRVSDEDKVEFAHK